MKERLAECGWPGDDPNVFPISPTEAEIEADAAQ